jgi:hypothetical protein
VYFCYVPVFKINDYLRLLGIGHGAWSRGFKRKKKKNSIFLALCLCSMPYAPYTLPLAPCHMPGSCALSLAERQPKKIKTTHEWKLPDPLAFIFFEYPLG